MTEKLDNFRPQSEFLNNVRRQIVNAGIAHQEIPMDWIEVATAATMKALATTKNGLDTLSQTMLFEIERGDDTSEYKGEINERWQTIPSDEIYFIKGCVARGQIVPLSYIDEYPKETDQCDGCGISSHCIKTITDQTTGQIESLCNQCISLHHSLRVQEEGGAYICEDCTKTDCTHHPKKQRIYGT